MNFTAEVLSNESNQIKLYVWGKNDNDDDDDDHTQSTFNEEKEDDEEMKVEKKKKNYDTASDSIEVILVHYKGLSSINLPTNSYSIFFSFLLEYN